MNRTKYFRTLLILFGIVLIGKPCHAQWSTEPVYQNGESGWTIRSLADQNGNPFVEFFDGAGNYRVMNKTKGTWQTVAEPRNGAHLDFSATNQLFGAWEEVEDFVSSSVEFGPIGGPMPKSAWIGRLGAIAGMNVDAAGMGNVIFNDTNSREILHSRQISGGWFTQVIAQDDNFRFGNPNIISTVDSADNLHVVWKGADDRTRYASQATGFDVQDVTPPEASPTPSNIEIDRDWNLHMVYDSFTGQVATGGLHYGVYVNGTWDSSRVDRDLGGFGSARPDFELDANGTPHIFSFDSEFQGPDVLTYSYLDDFGDWVNEPIDSLTENTISGPEEISALLTDEGFHVFYSLDDKNIRYAFSVPEPSMTILLLAAAGLVMRRRTANQGR